MIRTRFAPSPTGYLHIGGVRTALFNWLLARQSGGSFVLRIDDTDAARNVDEAISPILEGFRWLGLTWDEGPEVGGPHGPYFQSQRADTHRAAVDRLLETGHAYRDYARPEELAQQRDAAQAAGRAFVYDRRWMAKDDASAAKFEAEGRTAVVRLKMPREGECVIDDLIRGEVRVEWASEQDHVVRRADGSCLYHLASVVDDHELEITHVVRAAEHLPNTPRQVFILESLGYQRPRYAHLPYVAEPGGTAKLSKRKLAKYEKNRDFAALLEHGRRIAGRCEIEPAAETFNPVLVDFYREVGFLPEAILNYLLLLGWSLDGEREKFTVDEMVAAFTLDRINKAPASFDPQKLMAFQADAFAALSPRRRSEAVRPFAVKAGLIDEEATGTATDGPADNIDEAANKLDRVVELAGDRLKIAGDIIDFDYCFVDEFEVDAKAYDKRIARDDQARRWLPRISDAIGEVEPFEAPAIEACVKGFCEREGIKLGQIIHALRVATTGRPGGFGMFETLEVIGKDRTRKRIAAVCDAHGEKPA